MDIRELPPEITPAWSADAYGLVVKFRPRKKEWAAYYLNVRKSKGMQPLCPRHGKSAEEAMTALKEAIRDLPT